MVTRNPSTSLNLQAHAKMHHLGIWDDLHAILHSNFKAFEIEISVMGTYGLMHKSQYTRPENKWK